MAKLESVQPVLMVRDVAASIQFYQLLGFEPAFRDVPVEPKYAGVRRDGVEIHLQWHEAKDFCQGDRPTYRFVVRTSMNSPRSSRSDAPISIGLRSVTLLGARASSTFEIQTETVCISTEISEDTNRSWNSSAAQHDVAADELVGRPSGSLWRSLLNAKTLGR
jgi:hypothetical protein